MKLVSLNVGLKIDNSKKIGDFINSQNPDIVAFQEIVRHLDDSVFDMFRSRAHIEKVINDKLPYYFFGPQWVTNATYKNGKLHRDFGGYIEQGNEIITKFPILEAVNEHYYGEYSLKLDWTDFQTNDHPRSVEAVELDINGKRLQIINLHGIYSKDKQDSERTINQCKYVLNMAKRKKMPTIIVGDFNLFPETQSIGIISEEFRNLINEYGIKTTRPHFNDGTDYGDNVVDFIFVNDGIKVNNFEVINNDISDHLPLVLDFDLV